TANAAIAALRTSNATVNSRFTSSNTSVTNAKLNKTGGFIQGQLNLSNKYNFTGVNCIWFKSGGKICTGS
ncbi:MAG: hypothetical protein AABW88_04230, partial [Nanoarchaeota archaeon]